MYRRIHERYHPWTRRVRIARGGRQVRGLRPSSWGPLLSGVLVAACADGVPTEVVPSERPSLTAESRLLADTAVVTVTAANEGEVSIRYGRPSLCPMWVHVSTTAARDAVVWNEENWWNANHAGGCKSPTIERVLAPGASERLVGTIAVSDILGDTLPAGVYHVTAALVIGDPGLSRIDVPAGSLDLSPP